MTIAIDVNILVYATDAQSPFQKQASRFLAECLSGDEQVCLTWGIVMGYIRLVTNSRIMRTPLSVTDALDNVRQLLSRPHVRVLQEEQGFLDVYVDITRGLVAKGNAVPDAHISAILKQHGVRRFFTADADFRRFAFLKVENPLLN